ncbi:MAG: hypothetical protein RIK87_03295 [Fuerstiella sp.]
MDLLVPPSLLFDYRLRIPQCSGPLSGTKGRLLKLPESSQLFIPSRLNEQPVFASVRAAWNTDGFALSVNVSGKPAPPSGVSADLVRSDCLLVWMDLRPAGNVHRATEYCHHLVFLPVDEHQDGGPSVVVQPIAQQRARRGETDPGKIKCRTHTRNDGYELEIWIPGSQLYGFRDISELGRIGFCCVVQDMDLGEQPLSLGREFPIGFDPSTWPQLELTS